MNKICKRKKYYLVLDVETAGGFKTPLVYDIGFSIIDRAGHSYFAKHYIIYDVFIKMPKAMATAYYKDKIPLYWEKVLDGNIEFKRFFDARKEILTLMKQFHIKDVGAYNCSFDRNALNTTLFVLWGDEQPFFPKNTKFFCIWHMACQTICKQTKFLKFCANNKLESECGNVSTSAETVYRYLINNPTYTEEHMGLDDVKIETQIFVKCLQQHKKMDKNIKFGCWKIPQEKYRKVKGVE